jgi:hypothetical protein
MEIKPCQYNHSKNSQLSTKTNLAATAENPIGATGLANWKFAIGRVRPLQDGFKLQNPTKRENSSMPLHPNKNRFDLSKLATGSIQPVTALN